MTNAGTPPPLLFRGPESLRVPRERMTLAFVLASLPLTVVILGFIFQHALTWQQAMLLLVVAMVYVTLARGRLLGGGLRVHAGQFGHVHELVAECARMLRMPVPHVFVRDDPFVPIVGVGIGEPYAIVISSQYFEHFTPDELRFLVGRELAHIQSGHVRLTSLLSANGRENAVVAIAFGPWLRTIEYTADRVGLLCCGSLDAALSAIAVSTLHALGRKTNLALLAEQRRELAAEPMLRAGEWLGATPYVTHRIDALRLFADSELYRRWAPRFSAAAAAPVTTQFVPERRMFVGPWRRIAAFMIDTAIVAAIVSGIPAPASVVVTPDAASSPQPAATASARPHRTTIHAGPVVINTTGATTTFNHTDEPAGSLDAALAAARQEHNTTVESILGPMVQLRDLWGAIVANLQIAALAIYVVLMVSLVGRTVGMLIFDMRVVGVNGDRVGLPRTVFRYVCALLNLIWIPGWFGAFRRIAPYDKWSGTRMISGPAATGN